MHKSAYSVCRVFLWLLPKPLYLQPHAHCHCVLTYSFWELSLMVQVCENQMVMSPGCMQDVWAHPIAWCWSGPELCAMWQWYFHEKDAAISEFTKTFVLDFGMQIWSIWQYNSLHWLCCHAIFKSKSGFLDVPRGPVLTASPPNMPS
jgi:hypothetical protein